MISFFSQSNEELSWTQRKHLVYRQINEYEANEGLSWTQRKHLVYRQIDEYEAK